MPPFAKRFLLPLMGSFAALLVANHAHAALGDIVAQYTFPSSALVMSPTQALMYAAIPSQNSVAIINTNTLAVEHTVFVGSGPANLAFSPDGAKAYIANSTSNFVVVFDTQTRTVVNSFVLPEQPQDVVVGTLNRLWVLGQSQIFQIDATTGASTGPSINTSSPFFQISPDRNTIYCYDSSPAKAKYDVSGTTPVLISQAPYNCWSFCINGGLCDTICPGTGSGLTLSHSGSFICSVGEQCYEIPKYRTSDFAIVGSFGSCATQITFSPDDLVVYTATQDQIDVFNANTFVSSGSISASGQASDLTVDSTGRYLFAGYTDLSTGFTGTRVFDTGLAPHLTPPPRATPPPRPTPTGTPLPTATATSTATPPTPTPTPTSTSRPRPTPRSTPAPRP